MALQVELAGRVGRKDDVREMRRVAGVDVGFEDDGKVTGAAVAVLDFPGFALVERVVVREPTRFPYIPGLLSFREAPAVLAAFERLRSLPDLILYDGHGIAHPRRFGIASHVGVAPGTPAIGGAQTRPGRAHRRPPARRGAWVPLVRRGEPIGAVLRTRTGVTPLYVSIGHRVSLESAVRWVIACTTRYRLPETTRWAHHLASVDETARSLGARRG